jgi:hypothetical protein
MVDKLAAKANEKGNAKQAKVLYAASLTLEPTLARRVSMANMMLKSGEADQAQHEYNEILSSGEPLSEKIKTSKARAPVAIGQRGAHAGVKGVRPSSAADTICA